MSACGCQQTFFTSCVWAFKTPQQSKSPSSPTSQIHTPLSRLQVARKEPEEDQATHLTSFSWPSSVAVHSNVLDSEVVLSQMEQVASKLAEAINFPHGDQEMERMVRWCPSVRAVLHVQSFSLSFSVRLHRRITLSSPQEARQVPLGFHPTFHTIPLWPGNLHNSSNFAIKELVNLNCVKSQ